MLKPIKKETELRRKASYVNVLNYIWNNVDKDLSLNAIAKACGISKFHMHRIFKDYQSENLSEYITRKKLEYSANYLVMFPYINISVHSSSLGFSSPANFSKAFKKHFGITPREWKSDSVDFSNTNSFVSDKYNFKLDYVSRYSKYSRLGILEQNIKMKELNKCIRFVSIQDYKFAYLTTNNATNIDITNELWANLIEWASSNVENWHLGAFGLWYDSFITCPPKHIRYDAAVLIPNNQSISLPYLTHTFDSGVYATGVLKGSHEELTIMARDIYTFWFPKNRLIPDRRAYYVQYLNDYKIDGYFKIRFYIKIHTISLNKLNERIDVKTIRKHHLQNFDAT